MMEYLFGLLSDPFDSLQQLLVFFGIYWDPAHVMLETMMIVLIVYLMLQRTFKIKDKPEELTAAEEEELIDAWKPEPLTPPLSDCQEWDLTTIPTIKGEVKPNATIVEGYESPMVNLASTNFIGQATSAATKGVARDTLKKYGCGSCGPRGFYGTMDVHMNLEKRIAEFLGTMDACIYSSGFATMASVIPAFMKRQDLIIADKGLVHALNSGIMLSRAKVLHFEHNDVADLVRVLESVAKADAARGKKKMYRKLVVVEGVYFNHGDMAPLKALMELKRRYKFRILLDDSVGFGVLGPTGRGSPEVWGVPMGDIDFYCASFGHGMGSVGGVVAGSDIVAFHQRLNSSGYVFSASAPPYLVTIVQKVLDEVDDQKGALQSALEDNVKAFKEALLHPQEEDDDENELPYECGSHPKSPLLHLRFTSEEVAKRFDGNRMEEEKALQRIVDGMKSKGFLLTRAKYLPHERFRPNPSIRIAISSEHHKSQLVEAAKWLNTYARESLSFSSALAAAANSSE